MKEKFDKLHEMIVERTIKQWSTSYKAKIKSLEKLPWVTRPEKTKSGSEHEISGSIKGYFVSFGWDEKDWKFMGISISERGGTSRQLEDKFNTTWEDLEESPEDESIRKKNLKEFQDAIKFVQGLK